MMTKVKGEEGWMFVFYDFCEQSVKIQTKTGAIPGTEDWLQITQLKYVGNINREPIQKIVRIGPESLRELYNMLKERFEK